jgi:hypothetical protein
MDNTFFTGLTSAVGGTLGLALTSVVVVAALILGAVVGFRVYKRFTSA